MSDNKKTGRPPFYKTPEELRAAVNRYFESCAGLPVYDADGLPVLTKDGEQVRAGETPPTMSGLSLALGFKDRHTFSEQAKRGAAFREVVQLARLRVENYAERRLYNPQSYRGAAFVLQACFGWQQKADTAAPPEVRIITAPAAADPDGSAQAGRDPDRDGSTPAADPEAGQKPAHTVRIDMMN